MQFRSSQGFSGCIRALAKLCIYTQNQHTILHPCAKPSLGENNHGVASRSHKWLLDQTSSIDTGRNGSPFSQQALEGVRLCSTRSAPHIPKHSPPKALFWRYKKRKVDGGAHTDVRSWNMSLSCPWGACSLQWLWGKEQEECWEGLVLAEKFCPVLPEQLNGRTLKLRRMRQSGRKNPLLKFGIGS